MRRITFNKLISAIALGVSLTLLPTAAVNATDCTSADYPPGCTPVGTSTPTPTVIDTTSLSAIGDVTTDTFVYLGGSTPVVVATTSDPSSGTTSLTIPASATGGAPLVLALSSPTGTVGGETVVPKNGDMAFSTSGFQDGTTSAVYLHSTPVLLASVRVDSKNSAPHVFAIPANTPAGQHFIEFTGVLPNEKKISIAMPIKVLTTSVKTVKNQKKTYIGFGTTRSILVTADRKMVNTLIAGIPKRAKNIKVSFVSNYSRGVSKAISRVNAVTAYMKTKLKGATYVPYKLSWVSKVSTYNNMVIVTVNWK